MLYICNLLGKKITDYVGLFAEWTFLNAFL